VKLYIHKVGRPEPSPFRVRCQLNLVRNSTEERCFRTFGAPPLTDPPLEYEISRSQPPGLLTSDQLAALVTENGVNIDFSDVRKALSFINDFKLACKALPSYWRAARSFDDSGAGLSLDIPT